MYQTQDGSYFSLILSNEGCGSCVLIRKKMLTVARDDFYVGKNRCYYSSLEFNNGGVVTHPLFLSPLYAPLPVPLTLTVGGSWDTWLP